jgi:hypothetical protein
VNGELDLFKQITNAVLDLQGAQLQSYSPRAQGWPQAVYSSVNSASASG